MANNDISTKVTKSQQKTAFPKGGGVMGKLIAKQNWENYPLGPVHSWPTQLKVATNIILQSPAPMVILWGNEGYTIYNDAYIDFAGKRHPKLLGERCEEIWPEAAPFIRNVIDTCATGESLSYNRLPYKVYRNDFEEDIWMDLDCSPIYGDDGTTAGVLIVNIEVTHQIQTESSLKKAEERFETALSAAGIAGTWDWNLNENKIFTDLHFANMFSIAPSKVKDGAPVKDILKVIHENDIGKVIRSLKNAIANQQKFSIEFKVNPKGEKAKWVMAHGQFYYNEENVVKRFSGIVVDIDERKKAEKEIQENQEKLSSIVNQTSVGIAQTDLSGKFVWVNDRFCQIVDRTKSDLYQMGIFDITYAKDIKENVQKIENTLNNGAPYNLEKRYYKPDGSLVWVNLNVSSLKNKNSEPTHLIGVCHDITDKKLAEQALIESEKRFRSLADQSPMFVYIVEPNSEASMSYFNKTWLNYTGQTFEQAIGNAWNGLIHPDDLQGIFDIYIPFFQRKESYTLPAVRVKRHDGQYRWHMFKGNPRFLPNGKFIGYIGVGIDIHEQKVVFEEIEHKNNQLLRINNDLDNFIYTASHDLKAPISNIEGLVNALNSLLQKDKPEGIPKLIQMIYTSIEKFKNTIKDLTEVAKVQNDLEEDLSHITIKEIVDEVKINIKQDIVFANAVFIEDFSSAPSIYFSRKNLRSILYNLISNAIKYRSPERDPVVEIKTSRPDSSTLLLSIKDNGLGIKKEDHAKIFTMFKRLHLHVEGTGIGMSIVKKIVDNNGGRIELESKENEGTWFKIYLRINDFKFQI
jgi:PAS domain S-box-containing protein